MNVGLDPGPLAQAITFSRLQRLVRRVFVWLRLKIKLDCFTNILKRFFFGFTLRPATLQRLNVSDKIAVFAGFNDDFDIHGLRLSFRCWEHLSCYTHVVPSRELSKQS